jgi:Putative transmembrane protein (PGPGW)
MLQYTVKLRYFNRVASAVYFNHTGSYTNAREVSMWTWIRGHETLLWWLGALSIVMFVGTLVVLPLIVARLPADYFTRDQRSTGGHTPAKTPRLLGLIGKNLLGIVLILAGVAMLVLPGQGMLMILIGLLLMDFPGKRALERHLVQQPSVFQAINWIRAKAHRPALQMPVSSPSPSGREEA